MEPVGVGRRAVAVLIDSILLFVVGYAIAAMTGGTTEAGFQITGAPFLLWLAITLAYYIVMEATRGATLGKMAMRLKVVKEGGEAIDWQASIVRNVLRLIDGFFFYLVAAIVVWVTKKNQRLGDIAAHTIVVRAAAWVPVVVALALFGGFAGDAVAGSPRYTEKVLSDAKDGPQKGAFKPDTQKIFLKAKFADVPAGSKLKGEWIAVKTNVAPPNYRIDSTELEVKPRSDTATFTMTRPTAGWPEGDYRIDLFIDGKPAGKVAFKVAK